MRTRRSTTCLIVLFLYLCCCVQQCHVFMFETLANAVGNAVGASLTLTSTIGMTLGQSMMQSFISTVGHGFSTLHTMAMSLVSGFMMGNLFLAGFVLLLLALVPAEEFRGLGGSSVFSQVRHRHLLPYIPDHLDNSTEPDFNINYNSTLVARSKRSPPTLVSPKNASSLSFTLPTSQSTLSSSSPINSSQFQYDLRFALDPNDDDNPNNYSRALNGPEHRIPRFLTRLVQRDPFNCLPLLLCGLSAARKPSERTEVLNDYAYLIKEFMEPDEDRSEEDSEEEDDLVALGKGTKNRLRHGQASTKWLDQLVSAIGNKKDKDEVDKIIEQMRKEEDEKIEDLALTEMADDPNDLKFALEDMKLRGLSRTASKLPEDSKKEYFAKLLKDDSGEEIEGEIMDYDADMDDSMPLQMRGNYPRNDYPDPDSAPSHERGPYFYDPRKLIRGGFPKAPPEPPVPLYGVDDDVLYKKNLKILDHTLHNGPSPFQRRWNPMGPPMRQFPPRRRSKRDTKWRNEPPPPRGFLQKKRGEAATADNIFDKTRVGAEVGAITRNNRQCRALFNECPINQLIRPDDSGAPFLNRAVNNLRRVLLGTPPEGSKTRRVNEIKEVIQQLHPHANHGGSEVRVVLNIGPSPPPYDLHRVGGSPPPPQYTLAHINPSGPSGPSPMRDVYSNEYTSYKNPATTPNPGSATTRKQMNYYKPSLSLPYPTQDLSSLETLLKTTVPSIMDDEEDSTTMFPPEETTLTAFQDIDSGESGEMEDEPVFPTSYPISKDEYAQNLRETFNIFQKFKEANKPGSTLTTVRPRSSTTKRASVNKLTPGNKIDPNKKVPVLKPGLGGDEPQKDVDHSEDDVQGILDIIKKFREKYLPRLKKKTKKRRKKKKKKKKGQSSEESSEEHHHDPHHGYIPTLVAVPPPSKHKHVHWRSGTTLIKDGVYHMLFGRRQVKPLLPSEHGPPFDPLHFDGPLPHHHDHDGPHVHHHGPPHPHHHPHPHHPPHRFREDGGDSESTPDADDGEATTMPSSSPPTSSSKISTPKPKSDKIDNKVRVAIPKYKIKKPKSPIIIATPKPAKIKSNPKPPSKLRSSNAIITRRPIKLKSKTQSIPKQPSSNVIITRRPIKIKLKTLKPIILADSIEEEEEPDYYDMPPGPPHPPPPPPYHLRYVEDSSNSYEDDDDIIDMDDDDDHSVGPTKPQLLYTPFTHVNSKTSSSNSKKSKKANKGSSTKTAPSSSGRSFSTYKITLPKIKKPSSKAPTRATTTVKPKRKIKYKNG